MKKVLIAASPFLVVLCILMGVTCGLEGVFIFFGITLLTFVLVFGVPKWLNFVDKHIKD